MKPTFCYQSQYIAAMTITIYGIKNCDTMKKARGWLDANGVKYAFHDYKSAGIDRDRLERWCKALGWETLDQRLFLPHCCAEQNPYSHARLGSPLPSNCITLT
jgi:hypothetical protein